jgi:predicted phage terminase large subunit-like protein
MSSPKDALLRFEELKKHIARSTPVPRRESVAVKEKRIAGLLGDFNAFCHYYFPEYFDPANKGSEFGWFHLKAADAVINNRDIFAVLEWPREHAKSVFADIFMPLFLKAKGELDGLVLCSQSADKAKGLLGDIQAQLEANERYINDYGEQKSLGNWTEGQFVTRDGVGFWAIGKGQSPRGIREAEKRPNCLIIDDLDDDIEVQNEDRVQKSLDWVKGALIGAMSLLQARVIMVGNRIAKKSILSHIVGDIEDGDPKNSEITHIKVFALENPYTHEEDQSEEGVPAWIERYTREHILRRIRIMGYRMAQREFFHRQIKEGRIFKDEWLRFIKLPDYKYFDGIVVYCDPSFKDSKKNDFKAIIALGKIGSKLYLIDCWVRQASRYSMVAAHYNLHEKIEAQSPRIHQYYIEANFMQDQMIEDYVLESENRGYLMPIREDKRQKPNKEGRIENLSPLFEQGLVAINEELKDSLDYQVFRSQLTGFPNDHDDAPDAFEGAAWMLKNIGRATKPPQGGTYEKQNEF